MQLFKAESANHKRVSVYDSNRKAMVLFGEGHSGWSFTYGTFAIVAMIKSRILAATIQVSYSYHPVSSRSLSTVYRRKRDKRDVKRDSGT